MFPDNICQNIDILVVINVRKNNFGFHSNRKTQGQKHQVNNLYFKYQVCQMKLRHLNTFLQFRLLFHEPHCTIGPTVFASYQLNTPARSFFYQTMSTLLKTTHYMTFLGNLEVPDLIFWEQLDGGCGKNVKIGSFWPQNRATLAWKLHKKSMRL